MFDLVIWDRTHPVGHHGQTDKLNSSPISVFNCGLDPGPVSLNNLEKNKLA